ncbi:MAG: aminotransferase class III-fold pyridoxal phosphate-dependent enzyme [Anaerolineales bacterium]|nr:aminotransferase class III-fold pyridoxal phosphate-dependent enzyme [Anaerolineales bacterium]
MPPISFMKGLREICDRHGILLIFDEVQSGFWADGQVVSRSNTLAWFPDIIDRREGHCVWHASCRAVFSRTDIMQET